MSVNGIPSVPHSIPSICSIGVNVLEIAFYTHSHIKTVFISHTMFCLYLLHSITKIVINQG